MKRTITFIFALVLMVSLAACGGATENSADSTATDSGAASASTTADEQPAQEEEQPQEDYEKLIAEEKERMALEEEARLAALPKLPNHETGEYEHMEFGGIDWLVLDVVDDRVLLLQDKLTMDAIGNSYFATINQDGIPWRKWELREYLNGEFYNSFSAEDREKIVTATNKNREYLGDVVGEGEDTQDNVFLLSVEEVTQYFGGEFDVEENYWNSSYLWGWDNLIAYHVGGTYTDYDYNANLKEYTVEPGVAHLWALRSPATDRTGMTMVREDGTVSTRGQPVGFGAGVRPALWMRFDTSDIAERTITVLPSVTNDLASLSAGDTVRTDNDMMELLLNSQSVLKMDTSTDVTVEKLGANNLSLNIKSGAVLVDITRLRDDDKYEITVGDMTLSVKGTQFVIENSGTPRIIMLEGSAMINGETELSAGEVATVENGEVVVATITVDESTSLFTLEKIMENINELSLSEEDREKAIALIRARHAESYSQQDEAPQATDEKTESSETDTPNVAFGECVGTGFGTSANESNNYIIDKIWGFRVHLKGNTVGSSVPAISDLVVSVNGVEHPISGFDPREPYYREDSDETTYDFFFETPFTEKGAVFILELKVDGKTAPASEAFWAADGKF